nr:BrnA antitoxin family protein [uncultured Rhodopila sp.]
MSSNTMTKFSAADLELRARKESRTDMTRLRQMTEAEIEEKIAADTDWHDVPSDWHLKAEAVMPNAKKLLSLRIDAEVLDWFRNQGAGYQTRMNAVLRSFMEHEAKRRVG